MLLTFSPAPPLFSFLTITRTHARTHAHTHARTHAHKHIRTITVYWEQFPFNYHLGQKCSRGNELYPVQVSPVWNTFVSPPDVFLFFLKLNWKDDQSLEYVSGFPSSAVLHRLGSCLHYRPLICQPRWQYRWSLVLFSVAAIPLPNYHIEWQNVSSTPPALNPTPLAIHFKNVLTAIKAARGGGGERGRAGTRSLHTV